MAVICAKCNKPAYSGFPVQRLGKYGKVYLYWRYTHADKRKDAGVRYHYLRILDESKLDVDQARQLVELRRKHP